MREEPLVIVIPEAQRVVDTQVIIMIIMTKVSSLPDCRMSPSSRAVTAR